MILTTLVVLEIPTRASHEALVFPHLLIQLGESQPAAEIAHCNNGTSYLTIKTEFIKIFPHLQCDDISIGSVDGYF